MTPSPPTINITDYRSCPWIKVLSLPSKATIFSAIGAASRIPQPPTRPHEDECCRRGCDPCIFDYYERALDRWSDRVRKMGNDPDAILAQLTPPQN